MKSLQEKEQIINHCASTNTPEYNRTKVFEEIAEFQEIIAKTATKHVDHPKRVDKDELIKEFGDLVYRSIIYLKHEFPEMSVSEILSKVDARIEKKLTNLEEWSLSKSQQGGL